MPEIGNSPSAPLMTPSLRVSIVVRSLATTSRRRRGWLLESGADVGMESMSTCVVQRKPTGGMCMELS